MQVIAEYKNGKITNREAIELLSSRRDGSHLIDIIQLYPRSSQESRALFFYRMNNIARLLGEQPQDTYVKFKDDNGIDSLAGELSLPRWLEINELFKTWVWNKLEVMI